MVAFTECVERELVRDIESEQGYAASLNRSRVRASLKMKLAFNP